jgi:hypothetical protein
MKIMLATPMYGGTAHGGYVCSVAILFALCAIKKIDIVIEYLTHESLIPRARNTLVQHFMNHTDYTHMLFIDADIKFDPYDILKLIELDMDVIGMPYAKKQINWDAIQEHSETANGKLSKELLEKCGLSYILTSLPNQDTSSEIYEVEELGTGIMMIQKSVFEKMIDAYPNLYALSDDLSRFKMDDIEARKYYLFFETLLHEQSHRYLSEDFAFCKRWRDIGGKIFIYLPVVTTHYGSYAYQYDSSRIKLM